jgi:hypothetical protein
MAKDRRLKNMGGKCDPSLFPSPKGERSYTPRKGVLRGVSLVCGLTEEEKFNAVVYVRIRRDNGKTAECVDSVNSSLPIVEEEKVKPLPTGRNRRACKARANARHKARLEELRQNFG